MYSDRSEYDAVQINSETFDVTLVENAEAALGDEEFVFVIETFPQTNQSIRCTGKISYATATQGTFEIWEVFQTSQPDNGLFLFDLSGGESIKIKSSQTKVDAERNYKGIKGVGGIL